MAERSADGTPRSVPEPLQDEVIGLRCGERIVQARVEHCYGPPERRYALVWLTPELSGDVVDAPTTVSIRLDHL